MYKCGKCKRNSMPGQPAVRVVTEMRDVEYPEREFAMKRGRGLTRHFVADPGGFGFETVSEALMHENCAEIFEEERDADNARAVLSTKTRV